MPPSFMTATVARGADSSGPSGGDRAGGGVTFKIFLRVHSHSIVAGGLLVTSSTTRLISGTSLVILVEIAAST
jgi:hypothetical protein